MHKKIILAVLLAVFVLSLTLVACQNNAENNPDYVLPSDYPQSAAEPSLMLHYKRSKAEDYLEWDFWIWLQGVEGAGFAINYQDDYGGIALYPLSAFGANVTSTIGIIPRKGGDSWAAKDVDADRMLDLSACTLDSNNYIHVYLTQGDVNLYSDPQDVKYATTAYVNSDLKVIVNSKSKITSLKLKSGDEEYLTVEDLSQTRAEFALPEVSSLDFTQKLAVEVTFEDGNTASADVVLARLFDSEKFASAYHYDGELGAIYTSKQTTFRVWSPVSTKIVLNIYQKGNGTEIPETHEMIKGEKGVFEVALSGDLGGKYYTYTVFNYQNPNGTVIVDPYAKSAGLNGVRGQIVNFDQTDPVGWSSVKPVAYDRKELVVWETHVADVTSSETWHGTEAFRRKFLGVVQSGTTYSQGGVTVTTGFDHIVELGVNAVQLVPVFDQAGSDEANKAFNWGYNPLNYNVLEGSYSTDPTDGYSRIREFKQLVQAFNGKGINVIMDVVYNHVNAAEGSNFDVLMPGYYFRYDIDGSAYNGSGCGNETASEHSMFRKFMIDSVCFWAEEYKLGGFRFDLMGLHDIETMNQLTAALQQINPNIVVYGEPWTGGTSGLRANAQAKQSNGGKFEGYGQFNDQMRDALIKSGMKGVSELGWVTDASRANSVDLKAIENGLKGITDSGIKDPNKTVNYVTCHDNYTLYDRINAAGISDEQTVVKMAMLAQSVVFTSNGTAFMLAGEEFLRTKNVYGATADEVHNSYRSNYKVNELDYSRKITYADVFNNYKTLIAFKRNCAGLHLNEDEIEGNYAVTQLGGGSAIRIDINDSASDRRWVVIHANGSVGELSVDLTGYTVYLDTLGKLAAADTVLETTMIQPYQTLIVFTKN